MDRTADISRLKHVVLRDVAYLCRRIDRSWCSVVVKTLREFKQTGLRAVFFGGTIRSLLVSRLASGAFGRPRDLDIVIEGASVDQLKELFHDSITRLTRFGGLQVRRREWQFDMWPLQRTWAIEQSKVADPAFDVLPTTTFFNLEAVAVEVWPAKGEERVVYSGDEQFFKGILTRTLEINLEANPFPALCIARSLVLAKSLKFAIGPQLAEYLVRTSAHHSVDEIEEVQRKHYGVIRLERKQLLRSLDYLRREHDRSPRSSVVLAQDEQLFLWPPAADEWPRLHLHALAPQQPVA